MRHENTRYLHLLYIKIPYFKLLCGLLYFPIARRCVQFLLDRNDMDPLRQLFVVLGASNVCYNVVIAPLPRCSCPDHQQHRHHCKHILFVLHRVLGVSVPDEEDGVINFGWTPAELVALRARRHIFNPWTSTIHSSLPLPDPRVLLV